MTQHQLGPNAALGGISAVEAVINLKVALGGCQHQQAVPVQLVTGETVACLCIACLDRLPADWIDRQRRRAEREARCSHDRYVEDRRFGSSLTVRLCTDCGVTLSL